MVIILKPIKRKLLACLLSIGLCLTGVAAEGPLTYAATAPVASITTIGQNGYTGTIFGWEDLSYGGGTNKLTNTTLKFTGSQNWIGFDQNGNKITGSAGTTYSFSPLSKAPVQITTPGSYSYQETVTDASGAAATSASQSFSLSNPIAATPVSTINSTGANGVTEPLGFSVSTPFSSAKSNGSSITVDPNENFNVYDATSGFISTENWTLSANSPWSGYSYGTPVNSTGSWTYSQSSGVHFVAPYTYQVQTQAGYYYTPVIGYSTSCQGGYDDNGVSGYPPHPGACQFSWNTTVSTPIYGSPVWVPPVYTTYSGGNYWASGSWANPNTSMVNQLSTTQSYTLNESDGLVNYSIHINLGSYHGGIADFTLQTQDAATMMPFSNLGVTPTGNLAGVTETWYVSSPQGLKTFASLSALNSYAITTSTAFGATICHVVKIGNQTYIASKDISVWNTGFLNEGGQPGKYLQVTNIFMPATGQTFPTYTLPVYVKAGGSVMFECTTTSDVTSVTAYYSDGTTQNLLLNQTTGYSKTWNGWYYPSTTKSIPLSTPNGTSVTITKLVSNNGSASVTYTPTGALLIVNGTASNNGGTQPFRPPVITH